MLLILFIGLFPASFALAHDPFANSGQANLPIIFSALLLFCFWLSYTFGAFKVWPGWPRWFIFQSAVLVITFTLFGPLDEWADTNTAAHMTQHMIMIVIIAPMWVFAQPLPQLAASTGHVILWFWRPFFRIVRYPILAASLHGLVIWF